MRQGEGKYYWKSPAAIYQGNYANHKKEGHGLMKYPDGSVYEGDFHEGRRHGEGKYTYPNGDTYEGEWYQGKKHGKGVFTIKKEQSTVCIVSISFCSLYIFFLFCMMRDYSILGSGSLDRSSVGCGTSRMEVTTLESLSGSGRIRKVNM